MHHPRDWHLHRLRRARTRPFPERLEDRALMVGGFLTTPSYLAGGDSVQVAVGDFDGDGKQDLVTADNAGSTISLLRGTGSGAFLDPVRTPDGVVTFPFFLGEADFNGDGRSDLAVANQTGQANNSISILTGDADGTFTVKTPLALPADADGLAVQDFNADGKADVVVVVGTSLRVFLGQGNATFGTPVLSTAPAGSFRLQAGDFDGDSKRDLATVAGDIVRVMTGNGDGTFDPAVASASVPRAYDLASADLNGDGKLDLVSANTATDAANPGSVSILLGQGDATFQAAVNRDVNIQTHSGIATADFNADGKLDVAFVRSRFSTGVVGILHGEGDGTFRPAVTYTVGRDPADLAVGDFNGDGRPDMAALNEDVFNAVSRVSVLINRPSGEFLAARNTPVGSGPVTVALADLNADGKLDAVVSNSADDSLSLLPGLGDGNFGAPTTIPVGTFPTVVRVADLNGDGRPDLVATATNDDAVSILLNGRDGTFGAPVTRPVGSRPYDVAVADLTGDGTLDLVFAEYGAATTAPGSVSILTGLGDGTFGTRRVVSTNRRPLTVATADFNADGKFDIVTGNGDTNDVSILLNAGNGTFAAPINLPVGTYPDGIAVGDVNGDRKPDVVTANGQSNTVSLLLNTGNGTFATATSLAVDSSPLAVVIRDVNGDGKPDILTANPGFDNATGDTVSLLLGNGNGTFQAAVNLPAGLLPEGLAVGDLNRDGQLDLVTTNFGGDDLTVLLARTDPATLSVSGASRIEGNAGTGSLALIVTLSAPLSGPVTVQYATQNLTAIAGIDYMATSGQLTFPAGVTTRTISVPVLGDTRNEPDETFTVTLSQPSGATIAQGQATATITDDDPAGTIRLARATIAVQERAGTATVTIDRVGGTASAVTIAYTTSNGTAIAGTHYTATSGQLTFGANQTSRTISIPIADNAVSNPDRTFTLTLSNPSGGASLGSPATATVTIRDDESYRPHGDFDGDGTADVVVFRPSEARWLGVLSGGSVLNRVFGGTNYFDIPAPGDYDGDGTTDLVIFRPSEARWLGVLSRRGVLNRVFGGTNYFDIPVPGDYDGDGTTDLTIFRPSEARWLGLLSGGGVLNRVFGATNYFDIPAPGDYDGDGTTDLTIFRPSEARWLSIQSGGTVLNRIFGGTDFIDLPTSSPIAALVATNRVGARGRSVRALPLTETETPLLVSQSLPTFLTDPSLARLLRSRKGRFVPVA